MSNRDLEIMANERLQAETVALRKQIQELQQLLESEQHARWGTEQDRQHYEERCEKLLGLCLDCWMQFSYLRHDYTRHAGGHSTLEALEVELREAGLIDEQGRAVKR